MRYRGRCVGRFVNDGLDDISRDISHRFGKRYADYDHRYQSKGEYDHRTHTSKTRRDGQMLKQAADFFIKEVSDCQYGCQDFFSKAFNSGKDLIQNRFEFFHIEKSILSIKLRENSEPVEEQFQSHYDEHRTAGDLGNFFIKGAEKSADIKSTDADDTGDNRDDGAAQGNICKGVYSRHCKGNTDSQRIDAGCDRHQHQGFKIEFFRPAAFFLLMQGFPNHPAADKGKQSAGDPVIDGFDPVAKGNSEQPAEKGHNALKNAEGEGRYKGVPEL